ncbi:MAG TPA: type I polyketide synthase, partial [Bryobacteraceae bacterium]|nr:type I polyketide synthase [Bryobacteraceae bacterium]
MSNELRNTDIAVVGMAGRFPGARDIDQFWRNLRDGVESIVPLDEETLRAAGVPDELLKHPRYVRAAAVLDDMDMVDAGFFGLSPKDASIMDPQHRHFLECCWEAFEHSGYNPESYPGAVGVFGGCGMNSYFMFNLLTNPQLVHSVGLFLLRHTGNDKDFLATRVSYTYNLKGPSVSIQTACSTSLVAIHTACQSLLNGECDMALAGGVTIEIPHGRGYLYEEGEILSVDGHCRSFDAESTGTVFGSGVGVVVLKRAEDAVRDGDTIHAIIRGSAINNDGSSKVGYLAPSVDGQAAAVAEALTLAGVEPDTVTYVATHGTATRVGDPIEVAALNQAFGIETDKPFCALTSVKSNIGHLDTAAGVASFIAAVQAIKHAQIPPSLHFKTPNPLIDFNRSPFFVNHQLREWNTGDMPRRAGVSSLGVGGTNAHIILQQAPAQAESLPGRSLNLFPLSARSEAVLNTLTDRFACHLSSLKQSQFSDAAYTAQVGRKAFRHRRCIVAADSTDFHSAWNTREANRVISDVAETSQPSVVFLFAGGGAQHPGMGAALYRAEPVYRAAVDSCLAALRQYCNHDIRSVLFPSEADGKTAAATMERPSIGLPALFITEYALARLWMSWGIKPDAMVAHSAGAYAQACIAGVMTPEEALWVVYERGRLFETLPEGAMLSVPLSEQELSPLLGSDLSIAAVNSPGLCVASGNVKAINALEQTLKSQEVECQRIKIQVAAHSEMVAGILDDFRRAFAKVRLQPPSIPFVSDLTGTWITANEAQDPDYWVMHLRSTVRFSEAISCVLAEPNRIFLEAGPGRTLTSLTRQQPGISSGHRMITSLAHPREPISDLQTMLL